MGIFSFFTGSKSGGPAVGSGDGGRSEPAVDLLDTKGAIDIVTSKDLSLLLRGGSSSAGVFVSPESAMRYTTVWACVRLIAETIAGMKVHVYRKLPDGKERITDTPLASLFSVAPNSWQTVFDYVDFCVTSLCLRGNSYSYINRVGNGQLAELIPLMPQSVQVVRDGYDLKYKVYLDDGTFEVFPQEKIHHVRGYSHNRFVGVSPITEHRESIGLSIAATDHGASLFRNGAVPGGILTHPGKLKKETKDNMRESWNENYGGENRGRVAVFDEGLTFKQLSMSNEDAQYLETRQFQRTEICSIFRVPPHMIGDLTKSSFSNISQQSLEMVKYTFLPWVRRLEESIKMNLLTQQERERGLYVEFLIDSLERADGEQRFRTYNIGIMSGILSPNECRAMENRNPRPGGDLYLAPLNMADSTNGLPKIDDWQEDPDNPEDTKAGFPTFAAKSITVAVPALQGKAPVTKGVLVREQLRETFAPRFLALAKGLVLHETSGLRQAITAAEESGKFGSGFAFGMDELYRQLPAYIRNQFLGLMREYAVAVRGAALAEIDSDFAVEPEKMASFVDEILSAFTARYVGSSQGQLAALITETVVEELPAAIETRLAEWDAARPEKIAGREPVQQESAISRWVWLAAGVTKLQWQRRGSKSCPFCKALHGKIVGIGEAFIGEGDFTPEGHDSSPLKVRGPKLHAPIHKGCVCVITPVRG